MCDGIRKLWRHSIFTIKQKHSYVTSLLKDSKGSQQPTAHETGQDQASITFPITPGFHALDAAELFTFTFSPTHHPQHILPFSSSLRLQLNMSPVPPSLYVTTKEWAFLDNLQSIQTERRVALKLSLTSPPSSSASPLTGLVMWHSLTQSRSLLWNFF